MTTLLDGEEGTFSWQDCTCGMTAASDWAGLPGHSHPTKGSPEQASLEHGRNRAGLHTTGPIGELRIGSDTWSQRSRDPGGSWATAPTPTLAPFTLVHSILFSFLPALWRADWSHEGLAKEGCCLHWVGPSQLGLPLILFPPSDLFEKPWPFPRSGKNSQGVQRPASFREAFPPFHVVKDPAWRPHCVNALIACLIQTRAEASIQECLFGFITGFGGGTRIPSLICAWISWRLPLFKEGLVEDTAHYHCSHPLPWKAVCSKDQGSSTPNGWGNTDFWEELLVHSWRPGGGRKEGSSHTPCTTQSGREKMKQGKQRIDGLGAESVLWGWESFFRAVDQA